MRKTNLHFILIPLFGLVSNLSLSALSDKIRCTWRDNPATSMVIAWDQVQGANPVVYFDVVDQGRNFNAYKLSRKPDRIVSAKAQVSTLDSASSAAEAENARLADEERQLLLKQEDMKKASAESEHKKAQIQTKITSLKQEIGLLTSPEGQKETVEDLEAAERALQEKLKAAKEQGQASSQAKDALRDRSEDLQKQLAAQEAAEAAQKQETTLLTEQVSSLEEKAKQLKGRLESLKAEKALKEEEAKSRAQACSSDELQADSLQTEVDTLKARLQDAEVKTSSASAANLGLAKSIESLNSDLNSKLLSLQQAEEEVTKQHLRVEELKAKIEEADKKLSAGASPEPKSHELETLEKTLREKQADLDQITQGKTSQSTVIQTLRSQIIDIEKQILEARNVAATEIASLNDRLARLKQELLACNEQVVAVSPVERKHRRTRDARSRAKRPAAKAPPRKQRSTQQAERKEQPQDDHRQPQRADPKRGVRHFPRSRARKPADRERESTSALTSSKPSAASSRRRSTNKPPRERRASSPPSKTSRSASESSSRKFRTPWRASK